MAPQKRWRETTRRMAASLRVKTALLLTFFLKFSRSSDLSLSFSLRGYSSCHESRIDRQQSHCGGLGHHCRWCTNLLCERHVVRAMWLRRGQADMQSRNGSQGILCAGNFSTVTLGIQSLNVSSTGLLQHPSSLISSGSRNDLANNAVRKTQEAGDQDTALHNKSSSTLKKPKKSVKARSPASIIRATNRLWKAAKRMDELAMRHALSMGALVNARNPRHCNWSALHYIASLNSTLLNLSDQTAGILHKDPTSSPELGKASRLTDDTHTAENATGLAAKATTELESAGIADIQANHKADSQLNMQGNDGIEGGVKGGVDKEGGGSIERLVNMLVQEGAKVSRRCSLGAQPLHVAAAKSNLEGVHALLHHGASVNSTDHCLRTALHWAATSGNETVVLALLDAGADMDGTDMFGSTALMMAARGGHIGATIMLIAYGADVDIEEKWGATALSLARAKKHDYICQMLEAAAFADRTEIRGDDASMNGSGQVPFYREDAPQQQEKKEIDLEEAMHASAGRKPTIGDDHYWCDSLR